MPMGDWCDRQMLRKKADTYAAAEKQFWREIEKPGVQHCEENGHWHIKEYNGIFEDNVNASKDQVGVLQTVTASSSAELAEAKQAGMETIEAASFKRKTSFAATMPKPPKCLVPSGVQTLACALVR